MTNRTIELFWRTQYIVGDLLEDSNYLCETVEKEFSPNGIMRKELDDLEGHIKILKGVADPDVQEYTDLRELRAYFNLIQDMAKLEDHKDVQAYLNQNQIWLDNPHARHYIFKQHRLKRMKKHSAKLLKHYQKIYPEKPDNLESVIGQLDNKLAKLRDGNGIVFSLSETLKTYSDRRNTATKLAHGLLYAAVSYLQTAMTYMDINFNPKLLAPDKKAVRKFNILTRQRDDLVERITKFEKFGPEVAKIGYEEAYFDFKNHYAPALHETDDDPDVWPSNIELFASGIIDGECGDEEGEEPGNINPGSSGRFS